MTLRWLPALLWVLAACGGTVDEGPEAGRPDAAPDVIDAGPVDDAGYSRCMSPSGYAICGGGCDPPTACLSGCDASAPVQICYNKALAAYSFGVTGCLNCNDGDLCVPSGYHQPLKGLMCFPFELGELLYRADPDASADLDVTYYDRDLFTGDTPPNPSMCPSIPGVQVCGGNCGGCDTGQHCIGRAPLHPVGFCAATTVNSICGAGQPPCSGGDACFTFKVTPQSQSIADANGVCLPSATCQALAAQLPGGGACN